MLFDCRHGAAKDVSIPMKGTDGLGLYVHVAYCRRKCIYCDFFSAGEKIADWTRYVDSLCAEWNQRKNEMAYPLRTIYVGGGTPSLMPVEDFERLTDALSPYKEGVIEFTVEANPDDICTQKLEAWKRRGVNRLSIGIQSLDDSVLSRLGRRHDSACARDAYALARKFFDNISVDLIFGLPGQSMDMWISDIREVIAMRPEHISAYSLMYEEGTALTALRDNGRIVEAPEEVSEMMFKALIDMLGNAGYEHYETSNFALPGYRSRHNSSYWLQSPYIGLGPSAHSYDGFRTRRANRADLRAYIDYWTGHSGRCKSLESISETEILNETELIEEYVMTRLRMNEGIPLEDFRERFGEDRKSVLVSRCLDLCGKGLLALDNAGYISIPETSIMMSDAIILDVASAF